MSLLRRNEGGLRRNSNHLPSCRFFSRRLSALRFVQHYLCHGPMLKKRPKRTGRNIARGTRFTERSQNHFAVVLSWRWPTLPAPRGGQKTRLEKCYGVLVGHSGNGLRHPALQFGRRQMQLPRHDGSPSKGLARKYDSARTISVRL